MKHPKLKLHTETLRQLTSTHLRHAAGGFTGQFTFDEQTDRYLIGAPTVPRP
jgi:hypothetical protein